ncbi:MAG TPA: urease accessory UreF family protein [Candidatus Angelobacter sp.]|jgi:urease accessory protein|nr:urease accessory UreF family protein [Candidatus Angelobacter sp.]
MAALAGVLSLLQLSDSAFPSGRYTLSHGLEAYAQSGLLGVPGDASLLLELLGDSIRFGVAPSDGVALACAHRAAGPDGIVDLDLVMRADERLSAVRLAREPREASTRTGRALLGTAIAAMDGAAMRDYADLVAARRTPGNHAVVLGLLCAFLGVPRVDAVAGELYAFSAGWASAAVRLALTDHCTAQRLLHEVRPVTAVAALAAVDGDVMDIHGCTPLLDVMAMRHEQAELRLFAS